MGDEVERDVTGGVEEGTTAETSSWRGAAVNVADAPCELFPKRVRGTTKSATTAISKSARWCGR